MAVFPTPGSPIRAGLFLVFRAEDLDDPLDLLLPADDRVELARAGEIGEVDPELVDGRGLAGALRLLGRRAGRRALRQDPDDLVADLVEIHSERFEDPGGDPLAFAHEAEQEVLRPDVVVAEPARLVDRKLDDPLRPRRQADLADDRAVPSADDELDRGPDLGELDVHVLEDPCGDALALAHEAEQEVLRPDVVVVEPLGLILRQGEHLSGAVRELVETIHPVERLFLFRAASWAPAAMLARRPCPATRTDRTVGADHSVWIRRRTEFGCRRPGIEPARR